METGVAWSLPVHVGRKHTIVTMASNAASLTLTAQAARSAVAKVIAVCFPKQIIFLQDVQFKIRKPTQGWANMASISKQFLR